MGALPGAVIVIDSTYEDIVIKEAQRLKLPIIAVVDTNSNPEEVDFPVPGNDDAIRSIRLFISKFGEAVREGLARKISDTLNPQQVPVEDAAQKSGGGAPAEDAHTAKQREK
jgi:small subunit ribosomal protein S2